MDNLLREKKRFFKIKVFLSLLVTCGLLFSLLPNIAIANENTVTTNTGNSNVKQSDLQKSANSKSSSAPVLSVPQNISQNSLQKPLQKPLSSSLPKVNTSLKSAKFSSDNKDRSVAGEPEDSSTSKYDLSLKYTRDNQGVERKSTWLDDKLATSLELDVSGTTTKLENSKIRIFAPSDYIEKIDASDFDFSSSHSVQRGFSNGKTYVDVSFDLLKGGDKVRFYAFTNFKKYLTPRGQKVALKAELIDQNQKVLASSNDLEITAKVAEPSLSKSATSGEKSFAGEGNNGYATTDKAKSVRFDFDFSSSAFNDSCRGINSGVVTDNLPTYKDEASGKTVVATVDTDRSTGWSVSPDGTKAIFKITPDVFSLYGYTSYTLIKVKPIFLKFPGIKFDTKITNTADFKLEPQDKQAGESDFTGSATAQTTLVGSVEYRASFTKSIYSSARVQDTKSGKAAEQQWSIQPVVNDSEGLKEIVITDMPDRRLYIDTIKEGTTFSDDGLLDGLQYVQGRLTDGTWKKVSLRGSFWDNTVRTVENAKDYTALKLVFRKDYLLERSGGYFSPSIMVLTKFRDPSKISYNSTNLDENKFENNASISGVINNSTNVWNAQSDSSFELVPFEAPFTFSAYSEKSGTEISQGDTVNIDLMVGNTVPDDGKTTGRKLVVILPDGFDFVTKGDFFNPVMNVYPYSDKVTSYEVVTDYHQTGKRALVIKLNDRSRTNVEYDDNTKVSFRLRANKYMMPGENTVPVYYSFDGVDKAPIDSSVLLSGQKDADVFDINDNGLRNDSVGTTSLVYNYLPPRALSAISQIGHDDQHFSVYSIGLDDTKSFKLGMRLQNSTNDDETGIVMYNVLPHADDKTIMPNSEGVRPKRGSTTNVELTGPVVVPDGYTAWYLCEQPDSDAEVALKSDKWVQNPASWADVRAVKVLSADSTVLKAGANLFVNMPVIAKSGGAQDVAVDSFAYRVQGQQKLVEANAVRAAMPKKFHIKKNWLGSKWYDKLIANGASAYPKVKVNIKLGDKVFKTVELSSDDNWQKDVTLPAFDGANEAKYTFEEVPSTQTGFKDAKTDVNVKGNDVNITNTLMLQLNVEKKFTTTDKAGVMPTPPAVDLELVRASGNDVEKVVQEFKVPRGQNNFSQTINVPVCDENGNTYKYSLREKSVPEGWKAVGDGNMKTDKNDVFKATVSLENQWQNVPSTFNLKKLWVQPASAQKTLPDSVKVDVFAGDSKVDTVQLKADEGWQKDVTLPTFNGDKRIEYRFAEHATDGWKSSLTVTGKKVEVKNALLRDVRVKQDWAVSGGNGDVDIPETTVKLMRSSDPAGANAEVVKEFTFASDDAVRTKTVAALPTVDDHGNEYKYFVQQSSLPDGWKVTVADPKVVGDVLELSILNKKSVPVDTIPSVEGIPATPLVPPIQPRPKPTPSPKLVPTPNSKTGNRYIPGTKHEGIVPITGDTSVRTAIAWGIVLIVAIGGVCVVVLRKRK